METFKNGDRVVGLLPSQGSEWKAGTYVGPDPGNSGSHVILIGDDLHFAYDLQFASVVHKESEHYELDERVWCRFNRPSEWVQRHFSHYDLDGNCYCFTLGKTSWTTGNNHSMKCTEIRKGNNPPC